MMRHKTSLSAELPSSYLLRSAWSQPDAYLSAGSSGWPDAIRITVLGWDSTNGCRYFVRVDGQTDDAGELPAPFLVFWTLPFMTIG